MVPVEVAGRITLDMVLDTGSPASGLSARSWNALAERGLLARPDGRTHILPEVKIEEQTIPALAVRLSPRATELGADGILGLTFLGQFRTITFDVPSMRLTLTPTPP
jgi:hypothetical protein